MAFAAEIGRLVVKPSKGKDWSDRVDRMQASIGLGELREYFGAELAKRRPVEEKRVLRHYLERAFARMMVCDIAEEREVERDTVVRVSLEHMAKGLLRTDVDMFPFAVKMAGICTSLDGRWRMSDGPLADLAEIAEDVVRCEGRADPAWRRMLAVRAGDALGLRVRRM